MKRFFLVSSHNSSTFDPKDTFTKSTETPKVPQFIAEICIPLQFNKGKAPYVQMKVSDVNHCASLGCGYDLYYICSNWLSNQNCPYGDRCNNLHPRRINTLKNLFSNRICREKKTPQECDRKGRCLFAHDPKEVSVPSGFERSTGDPGPSKTPLRWKDGKESIPDDYIADTVGRRNDSNTLCTAVCDLYERCSRIHVLLDWWETNPKAKAPLHWYFKGKIGAATVPAPLTPSNSLTSVPLSTTTAPAWGNTKAVQTSTKSTVKMPLPPPSPAKTIAQNIEAVPAGKSSPETIPATQETVPAEKSSPETVPAETHRSSSPTRAARYVPAIQRMEDDINWKNLIDVDIQLKFDPAKKLRQFVQMDVPESERQRPSSKFRIPIEDWIRDGRACSVGPEGKRIFYHPTLLLGSGGSARVYIGLREDDWTEVALKAIDGFREDDTEKEAFYNMEIVALKERNTLNHVIKYFGCYKTESGNYKEWFIVMEMMEYTLEHVLTKWKSVEKTGSHFGTSGHIRACRYIAGSILWSLRALQENMDDVICVHRDIKPANIQFDRQKRIRLIDFGSATRLKNLSSKTTVNNTSTLFYAAPELLTDEKKVTHPKSDLFSFGIVLYELATGSPLRLVTNFQELTTSPKGEAQKWWPNSPHYSKALQHMVKWVVCKNPDEVECIDVIMNFIVIIGQRVPESVSKYMTTLLSHPFFWTEQKSTGFLIALGDLIRMWKDLKKTSTDEDEINSIDDAIHLIRHKVDDIVKANGCNSWTDLLPNQAKEGAYINHIPFKEGGESLLVCVRHYYNHPPTIQLDMTLFLHHIPDLVIELWLMVLKEETLSQSHYMLPYMEYNLYHPDQDLIFSAKDD
ncbi:hypothetical protein PROFUN_07629 [Planoprotostelium fungivorum]|uniref:Uncharacterized protein n=1 Tax=Planoprotostelium fungivorum TaxID=1890364 RepID=A0A2P6NK36_9EUKA|nr:hypothetical protein PROFUN_07629 [Planoprotostelium fungivorum]